MTIVADAAAKSIILFSSSFGTLRLTICAHLGGRAHGCKQKKLQDGATDLPSPGASARSRLKHPEEMHSQEVFDTGLVASIF